MSMAGKQEASISRMLGRMLAHCAMSYASVINGLCCGLGGTAAPRAIRRLLVLECGSVALW